MGELQVVGVLQVLEALGLQVLDKLLVLELVQSL